MKSTSYGRGGGYGRQPYGFRSQTPKPVEAGKEYNVTITETSRRGDGVAKIDGFVIFVSGAQRGEQARIKVTNVGPRFANAEKIEATDTEVAKDTSETES
ncbi:MAG: TRAM domain-containing protein [Nitrososphaerales archaeon]